MTDAPERIYADICEVSVCGSYDAQPFNDATEYTRADLCADPALLAEAVEVAGWLAALPIGDATADDVPLYGLDGRYITHGHIRAARAFIAKLENRQ